LLGWLLRQAGKDKNTLIERVVVVAEGYKATQATMTTALDGMKGAQAAMSQAVHDLAREAEAEAREGRHGLAQITQIVSHSAEQIRRLLDQVERITDRGRG
jgi:ABC-type transporter Mla subunit MlaD